MEIRIDVKKQAIIIHVHDSYKYSISFGSLWSVREINGKFYNEWLVHLAEKTWMTPSSMVDLGSKIEYVIERYNHLKPKSAKDHSIEESIEMGIRLLDEEHEGSEDGTFLNL